VGTLSVPKAIKPKALQTGGCQYLEVKMTANIEAFYPDLQAGTKMSPPHEYRLRPILLIHVIFSLFARYPEPFKFKYKTSQLI
jgi:hypothetical protein